jgi:hypothetical protein
MLPDNKPSNKMLKYINLLRYLTVNVKKIVLYVTT